MAGIGDAAAARHVVGMGPAGGDGRGRRVCLLAASGWAPGDGGDGGAPGWSLAAAEEALEAAAAELEGGEEDQDLVIRGAGESGDLVLDLAEVRVHASLRDRRAWLRTGAPRPTARREAVLHAELEGDEAAVVDAAGRLARELGAWVELRGLTLSWRELPAVGAAAPGLPGEAAVRDIG